MFSAVTSALQSMWREVTADLQLPPALQPLVAAASSASTATSTSLVASPPPTHSPINREFLPTPYDVQHARLILVRGLGLPVELVDLVIDSAQYWPAVVGTTTAVGGVSLRSYHGSSSWFDACILRPLPPSTPRPPLAPDVAARIEQLLQRFGPPSSEPFPTFLVGNLLSHDPEDARDFLRSLGWDFVERVERVEVDGEVGERRGVLWKVQTNVVASTDYHVHEGEWRRSNEHYWGVLRGEADGEDRGCGDGLGFVDEMKVGDRFPGWVNDVDEVNVEIRYSV
ncbi:hypothetical protein UCDDS831_g03828 [Diplodia seriata]|uniref:Uncharacterized protein n=1 Tax=Diplodia seriata TaxID=420778 RepID=A0A0G2EIR6_9PEZI|nr:hypothetical protein UCDDS831_g03828 [Diplodia seriata]